MASFFCDGVWGEGGRPVCFPWAFARLPPSAVGGACADKITLHIRQSAKYRRHQAPGAGAGVGPRIRLGSKLRLGVHDALDDGEQVERTARQPVNPCHRHHVAGAEPAEHPVKLAPVGRAQLLKLAVEGLPVGADAGIADRAFFGSEFQSYLMQTVTHLMWLVRRKSTYTAAASGEGWAVRAAK
jgi:hypothetical protein